MRYKKNEALKEINEEDSDFEPELSNRERGKRKCSKKTPFNTRFKS